MMRGRIFSIAWTLGTIAAALLIAACASAYKEQPFEAGGAHRAAKTPPYAESSALSPQELDPALADELWIIGKPASSLAAPSATGVPGSLGSILENPATPGGTLAAVNAAGTLAPLPLIRTVVAAQITGFIATVAVSQQFQNPSPTKIDAVYAFTLPPNAAVNDFVMTIGERHIRGIIRESAEAQAIYAEARRQGFRAALLAENQPNVFTQSIANLEPGRPIEVRIQYFHTLDYDDGWLEWRFPLAVAAETVPENPWAPPDLNTAPSPHASPLTLAVQLTPGMPISQLTSVNHRIHRTDRQNTTLIELDTSAPRPNKDFVLRYKAATNKIQSAMFVQRDANQGGGTFALMLLPPETVRDLPRRPVEVAYFLDTRTAGPSLDQSKTALDASLGKLLPTDAFRIIPLSAATAPFARDFMPANRENLAQVRQYLRQVKPNESHLPEAMGADMVLAALHRPNDPQRRRVAACVFSDQSDAANNDTFDRISHPALTSIALDFPGVRINDMFPKDIPVLQVGRMTLITGRFTGNIGGASMVTGERGGEHIHVAVATPSSLPEASVIGAPWARAKIADLENQSYFEHRDTAAEVKQLALSHNLVSQFTSFIMVDATRAIP